MGGVSLQVGVGSSSVQWLTILDRDGGSPSSSIGLAGRGDLGGDCAPVTGLVTNSGYTSSYEEVYRLVAKTRSLIVALEREGEDILK